MRLLLYAFPAGFRRRYGSELLEMVEAGGRPVRDGADLLAAGLRERIELSFAWLGRLSAARGLATAGVIAAVLGSIALGGCVMLGSAAAAGASVLAVHRSLGGPIAVR